MRRRQEDHYLVAPLDGNALLVAVADGMGGHPCGDDASRIAIETLRETVTPCLTPKLSPEACSAALYAGVAAAHASVRLSGSKNLSCQRLGTTLVAAMVLPREGVWVYASAGDSHLYRTDEYGTFTHVNELQADCDGKLTSFVGCSELVVGGTGRVESFRRGETLLLASDGLDTLTLAEVGVILEAKARARDASHALLQAVTALNHARQDNATVVVVRIE